MDTKVQPIIEEQIPSLLLLLPVVFGSKIKTIRHVENQCKQPVSQRELSCERHWCYE